MYANRGPVIKERKRAADAAKSLNDNVPITARATRYTYQVSTQPPSPRPKKESPNHCSFTPNPPPKKKKPLQPQSLPDLIPNFLLILRSPFPPDLRSLHIRRTLIVRLSQHTHNRDQDLLDTLDGRPSFRGVFVVIRVVTGWMKDGYTNCSVGVN